MRVLRLILAGIIALGVLFMGFLTALLLMITGLVGYMIQLFRPKPSGRGAGAGPGRRPSTGTGDVIDVVATKVPSDPPKLGAER